MNDATNDIPPCATVVPDATPGVVRAGLWRSLHRALDAWWSVPNEDLLRLHWPRHRANWNDDDFTPEAVRARIMRASPFPHC
jgi:hypothetical protein